MNAMFIRKNSPFFRFARIVHLGFVSKEKFQIYMGKMLENYNITFDELFLEDLINFTEGHPYYSQLALQTIIIQVSLSGITPDLDSIKSLMLNSEQGYLEKTWEDIVSSKENVRVLLALTDSASGLYSRISSQGTNVYRGLTNLVNKGILVKMDNKTYKYSDPLFRIWVEKNIKRNGNK
jgi:hypothetical protein